MAHGKTGQNMQIHINRDSAFEVIRSWFFKAVCSISLKCNSLDSKDQGGRLRKTTAFKDHFCNGISFPIALVQLKYANSFH